MAAGSLSDWGVGAVGGGFEVSSAIVLIRSEWELVLVRGAVVDKAHNWARR